MPLPCWYDIRGYAILRLAYQIRLWELTEWFSHNISTEHLEVAVGSGSVLDLCLRESKVAAETNLDVIDIDEGMIDNARKVLGNRVRRYDVMDVATVPLLGNMYRSINMSNCIHCFDDPQSSLSAVFSVLLDGGSVAANVLVNPDRRSLSGRVAAAINAYGQRKGILKRPYSCREVFDLFLRAGFTIGRWKVSGNCIFILARKNSRQTEHASQGG